MLHGRDIVSRYVQYKRQVYYSHMYNQHVVYLLVRYISYINDTTQKYIYVWRKRHQITTTKKYKTFYLEMIQKEVGTTKTNMATFCCFFPIYLSPKKNIEPIMENILQQQQ